MDGAIFVETVDRKDIRVDRETFREVPSCPVAPTCAGDVLVDVGGGENVVVVEHFVQDEEESGSGCGGVRVRQNRINKTHCREGGRGGGGEKTREGVAGNEFNSKI